MESRSTPIQPSLTIGINPMPSLEQIDNVYEIIEKLSERKLPFFLRMGISFVSDGIKQYYKMKEKEYDEEDRGFMSKGISLKTSILIVILVHVGAIAGVMHFSSAKKAFAKEDANFLKNDTYTGIPEQKIEVPKKEEVKKDTVDWATHDKDKVIQVYIVRKGDTFNSLVNKYKLNPKKFKQINNIKNENLLFVGQTLKLK